MLAVIALVTRTFHLDPMALWLTICVCHLSMAWSKMKAFASKELALSLPKSSTSLCYIILTSYCVYAGFTKAILYYFFHPCRFELIKYLYIYIRNWDLIFFAQWACKQRYVTVHCVGTTHQHHRSNCLLIKYYIVESVSFMVWLILIQFINTSIRCEIFKKKNMQLCRCSLGHHCIQPNKHRYIECDV